ncbi:ATP-grasp domain-containing protein [Congregibacter variabilis]|uniref:ATP-grasp domain-containing protein n=1 Tax=Congregibacter variabilis TaxID=3081200 RepID=A0ABZ0I5K0_9GAMM|nr:ATP-grasp domain-containing protein [Congregibacter sp. IMCC43200]
MTKSLTVAITGMNARPDNPGPGVAVARCLRDSLEFTGRIIGLGYDALDPGLYLREYCDAAYLLPYPSAGGEAFMASLRSIHASEEIDVILPCLDAELPGLVRLTPQFDEMGIRHFLPSPEQLRLRSKDRLPELAGHAGIHCPEIKMVTHSRFFYRCEKEGWNYPMVVKGLFYGAQIVQSADQAADAFGEITAQWGYPVLVQRLVEGEECNLTAICDGTGKMLGEVMMKKMAVTEKGKAWSGVSIFDQTLYDASAALVKAINWRGPLEVEVMRDNHGDYQLIEINPRFPAWIYLSAGVGRNLPMMLLKLILGEEIAEPAATRPGMVFIRHAVETIIPQSEFEAVIINGGQSFRPASRALRVTSVKPSAAQGS